MKEDIYKCGYFEQLVRLAYKYHAYVLKKYRYYASRACHAALLGATTSV